MTLTDAGTRARGGARAPAVGRCCMRRGPRRRRPGGPARDHAGSTRSGWSCPSSCSPCSSPCPWPHDHPAPSRPGWPPARSRVVGDYVRLTKPRIISLLLLTTGAARCSWPPAACPSGWLFLWTMVGGYLAAGGANAINQYVDRDIDDRMQPHHRAARWSPGRVAPARALAFGIALGVAQRRSSSASSPTGWPPALALLGLALYVGVYTLWLKRTSIHNIVIGGSAGAVPPLVGWAAVTGDLSLVGLAALRDRLLLDAPALLGARADAEARLRRGRRADAAGGARRGRDQAADPLVDARDDRRRRSCRSSSGAAGAALPGRRPRARARVFLVPRLARLDRDPGIGWARATFHYSLLYLALIFVALVVDAA